MHSPNPARFNRIDPPEKAPIRRPKSKLRKLRVRAKVATRAATDSAKELLHKQVVEPAKAGFKARAEMKARNQAVKDLIAMAGGKYCKTLDQNIQKTRYEQEMGKVEHRPTSPIKLYQAIVKEYGAEILLERIKGTRPLEQLAQNSEADIKILKFAIDAIEEDPNEQLRDRAFTETNKAGDKLIDQAFKATNLDAHAVLIRKGERITESLFHPIPIQELNDHDRDVAEHLLRSALRRQDSTSFDLLFVKYGASMLNYEMKFETKGGKENMMQHLLRRGKHPRLLEHVLQRLTQIPKNSARAILNHQAGSRNLSPLGMALHSYNETAFKKILALGADLQKTGLKRDPLAFIFYNRVKNQNIPFGKTGIRIAEMITGHYLLNNIDAAEELSQLEPTGNTHDEMVQEAMLDLVAVLQPTEAQVKSNLVPIL